MHDIGNKQIDRIGDLDMESTALTNVQHDATKLVLPETMTFEEWERVGNSLQQMQRSILWWVGDWLNFGDLKYGEKYAQAIEGTGYSYQALADAAYVCRNIDASLRREILTFSHHREVAKLEAGDQAMYLDIAEEEKLTTKELRKLINGSDASESVDVKILDVFFLPKDGKKEAKVSSCLDITESDVDTILESVPEKYAYIFDGKVYKVLKDRDNGGIVVIKAAS